jgi:hypothetical protein
MHDIEPWETSDVFMFGVCWLSTGAGDKDAILAMVADGAVRRSSSSDFVRPSSRLHCCTYKGGEGGARRVTVLSLMHTALLLARAVLTSTKIWVASFWLAGIMQI